MASNHQLHTLYQSWRAWLGSDSNPAGPKWLSWVWTLLFCCLCALVLTVLGYASVAEGKGPFAPVPGWWSYYRINLVISLFIGFSMRGLSMLGFYVLGHKRIRGLSGVARLAYFGGLPLVGIGIGCPLGMAAAGYGHVVLELVQSPQSLLATGIFSLTITAFFYILFSVSAQRLQAEKRAVEAQLRLLQGQIEPHFLFNTLANVVSLMDEDTPRAKHMLETFTDYLRSSLGSLRRDDATLGSELELVHHYLELMQFRMEDRLQFSLDADGVDRNARIPPLLLQPLVENAIHHGLEPKVEGGTIRVSARREGPDLVLDVEDDGMGLGAPNRRAGGAGIALANLRERLGAQYGDAASLALVDCNPGTRARLRVPFELEVTV